MTKLLLRLWLYIPGGFLIYYIRTEHGANFPIGQLTTMEWIAFVAAVGVPVHLLRKVQIKDD